MLALREPVDAGFAATWRGRRAGEPLGRRPCLPVAGDLGDKDPWGQTHGERQGAVAQAGMTRVLPRRKPSCPARATRPASITPRRNSRLPRRAGLRREPGVDRARGQAGHPHSRTADFLGQGLGERQHVGLRRVVHGRVRARLERGRGGDIQDPPAAPFQHPGQQQGGQPRQVRHVDLDHLQLPPDADPGDRTAGPRSRHCSPARPRRYAAAPASARSGQDCRAGSGQRARLAP